MSITDELRSIAAKTECASSRCEKLYRVDLERIADRIDAAHERALVSSYFDGVFSNGELAENGFIRLPVDADGEVIHVGDMIERGKSRGHVIALMLCEYPKKWSGGLHWAVQLEGEQAPTVLDAFFHHYHAPTVEDVLCELLSEYREGGCTLEESRLSEYADKLRLADEKE